MVETFDVKSRYQSASTCCSAQAAIRRLHTASPITQDELDAAVSAKVFAWGGAVKVIEQCRADASQPAPARRRKETVEERSERITKWIEDKEALEAAEGKSDDV